MPNHPPEVSAVILAGGQGSRLGGLDKGLVPFQGIPLVQQIIQRLSPQLDNILISANRSLDAYRAFGYPVLEDEQAGFQGPLMGMLSALRISPSPWTLFVPCDTPFLPADLLERLLSAAQQQQAEIAIAADEQQRHPVIALINSALAEDLAAFLASGERRVMGWYQQHRWIAVPFSPAQVFFNLNSAQEFEQALSYCQGSRA